MKKFQNNTAVGCVPFLGDADSSNHSLISLVYKICAIKKYAAEEAELEFPRP